jgi:CheY-like chemotaxis protein
MDVNLQGKRVLVVEDEALLALFLEDMLGDAGVEVVGPAGTLEAGLELAEAEALDAAVLDINLNGLRSFPIADRLHARGVPYVFATGYATEAPGGSGGAPVVLKPYKDEDVQEALRRALG